jgi:hypothetical protein
MIMKFFKGDLVDWKKTLGEVVMMNDEVMVVELPLFKLDYMYVKFNHEGFALSIEGMPRLTLVHRLNGNI